MKVRVRHDQDRASQEATAATIGRAGSIARGARPADVAATLGNQSVRRLLATPRPIPFPHASRVRDALGTSAPLRGVYDPEACAMRRTPAFTTGGTTFFADAQANFHVATHEAVHQLQHAGVTNDAGLGPEGQACAAADAAWAGRSAASLIGPSGRRVPPADRNYVFTDKTGRWKDITGGAALGRLSETGETLTFHGHDAYATPALIASAGAILKAKRSGLEISDGGAAFQIDAPDGSGAKSLSKIAVRQVADPGSTEFFGDCGRLAREVMGPTGQDAPASVVCAPGGVPRVIDPVITKKAAMEHLALMLFLDRRMRETPGYATMSDEDKKTIADKARDEYLAKSDSEKEEFIRKELQAGHIPAEKAKELGIDQYAEPAVGEAYTIVRTGPTPPDGFPYHWAAVIMIAGANRVTFENAAESGDYDRKNQKWYIETYGPPNEDPHKDQSFHEAWRAGFGDDPHTLTGRTQPPAPPNVGDIPGKSTSDLVAWYRTGTAADRYYVKQELDKRVISAVIQVVTKEDWAGDDEPFLEFSTATSVESTGKRAISEGTVGTFSMSVGRLLPVDNPLKVFVYEYDLLDPSDLIGTIDWPAPYAAVTRTLTGDDARYVVTLSL